jgi:hypothetical protein
MACGEKSKGGEAKIEMMEEKKRTQQSRTIPTSEHEPNNEIKSYRLDPASSTIKQFPPCTTRIRTFEPRTGRQRGKMSCRAVIGDHDDQVVQSG